MLISDWPNYIHVKNIFFVQSEINAFKKNQKMRWVASKETESFLDENALLSSPPVSFGKLEKIPLQWFTPHTVIMRNERNSQDRTKEQRSFYITNFATLFKAIEAHGKNRSRNSLLWFHEITGRPKARPLKFFLDLEALVSQLPEIKSSDEFLLEVVWKSIVLPFIAMFNQYYEGLVKIEENHVLISTACGKTRYSAHVIFWTIAMPGAEAVSVRTEWMMDLLQKMNPLTWAKYNLGVVTKDRTAKDSMRMLYCSKASDPSRVLLPWNPKTMKIDYSINVEIFKRSVLTYVCPSVQYPILFIDPVQESMLTPLTSLTPLTPSLSQELNSPGNTENAMSGFPTFELCPVPEFSTVPGFSTNSMSEYEWKAMETILAPKTLLTPDDNSSNDSQHTSLVPSSPPVTFKKQSTLFSYVNAEIQNDRIRARPDDFGLENTIKRIKQTQKSLTVYAQDGISNNSIRSQPLTEELLRFYHENIKAYFRAFYESYIYDENTTVIASSKILGVVEIIEVRGLPCVFYYMRNRTENRLRGLKLPLTHTTEKRTHGLYFCFNRKTSVMWQMCKVDVCWDAYQKKCRLTYVFHEVM